MPRRAPSELVWHGNTPTRERHDPSLQLSFCSCGSIYCSRDTAASARASVQKTARLICCHGAATAGRDVTDCREASNCEVCRRRKAAESFCRNKVLQA